MAINVLQVGAVDVSPPKKKRDSQIQENAQHILDQPTLYDLVLSFFFKLKAT